MSFFISDIIAKSIAVIFIPLFAFYMGPKELGLFGEWFSSYNILLALFSFGSSTYILVLLNSNSDTEGIKNQFLIAFLKWIFFMGVISFLFVCFFKNGSSYSFSIIIVALSFSFIQIYEALLRYFNQRKKYLFFQLFLSILTSVIPFLFVLYNSLWEFRSLGLVIAIFIILIYSVIKIFNNFKFNTNNNFIQKDLIKFGFPIFLISAITWMKLLVDLKLLKSFNDLQASGVLFFSFQVLSILSILSGSLNKSSTPTFFNLFSENKNKDFLIIISKLSFLIFLFSIVLIFLINILISYKLTEYEDALFIIYLMIIGNLFYSIGQFFSAKFLFFKKTYINAICLITSSIIHPFITYIIIKEFYWTYIGYSYLISNFIFFLLVLFFYYTKEIKELHFVKE